MIKVANIGFTYAIIVIDCEFLYELSNWCILTNGHTIFLGVEDRLVQVPCHGDEYFGSCSQTWD